MSLAPIAFFAYSRPQHTFRALQSLAKNLLISDSELFIFCDGPKQNDTFDNLKRIEEVRHIASSVNFCKKVRVVLSEENMGLAKSIVNGVTQLTNEYGKVIVIEDDLLTSPGFLQYCNKGLELYEDENKLMHISGYMYPQLRYPFRKPVPETFVLRMMACWGWATWKRAWANYRESSEDILHELYSSDLINQFNLDGSTKSFEHQLILNNEKKINTWAVKWYASIFLKNGLCLFPKTSLVKNIGNDGSGIHGGTAEIYDKQKTISKVDVQPIELKINKTSESRAKWFHHFIEKRKSLFDKVIEKLNFIC